MSTLAARVAKLERFAPIDPDDCDAGPSHVYVTGDPPPADPNPCRRCGRPHVLELAEEIVSAPEDPHAD